VRTGDVVATGTVSGPTPAERGCLLEHAVDGGVPRWLADGDAVVLRGWAGAGAARVDLGDVAGTVVPA
jgi:fumarylacetoacetase